MSVRKLYPYSIMASAIFALCSWSLHDHAVAQTAPAEAVEKHYYEVRSGDKTVGEVLAEKKTVGDVTRYEVRSNVTISMVFKVHVAYKVIATYRDGVMEASTATVYVNGSAKDQVDALRSGDHYQVVIDGDITLFYGDITASSATLYFDKPEVGAAMFSETSGVLKVFTAMRDGRLMLRDPDSDSNHNTYLYENDHLLSEVAIERFLYPSLSLHHTGHERPGLGFK